LKDLAFFELTKARKKKVTRRDRFLSQIDAVTPWVPLVLALQNRGRCIRRRQQLRMTKIAAQALTLLGLANLMLVNRRLMDRKAYQ
jgi:hypothetical protein